MKGIAYQPVEWLGERLKLLDQSKLPDEEAYFEVEDYRDVASAIKEMKVRGAPVIGVVAAYGVALGALKAQTTSRAQFAECLQEIVRVLGSTRPTGQDLFHTLERMQRAAEQTGDASQVRHALVDEAVRIHQESVEATRRLSDIGASLLPKSCTVLTHCNTGPLAATGYGTALGIIITASERGNGIRVLVTETRPMLQGARLTTWELQKAGIPFTLITDSMAGYFMRRGDVNCIIVGADRIAANGDTANKIGTYPLAVLAKEHGIPFYIAAPTSSVDLSVVSGADIMIEERPAREVTHIQGVRIAPDGTIAANPAFDVTPHRYISAIVTERGIIKPPYKRGLKKKV